MTATDSQTVIIRSSIQRARTADGVWISVSAINKSIPTALIESTVGDEQIETWCGLGETFPLDDQIWRFEDIEFGGRSIDWQVTVRQVLPDTPPYQMPPLTPYHRIWNPAPLQPFGALDETTILAFEERIGTRLPDDYRQWLAENNGAAPTQDVWIRGRNFCLNSIHPLLGLRPDSPYQDLSFGESRRKPWLTDDYLVIAVPLGGLLAVKIRGTYSDQIVFLSDAAMQAANAYAQAGFDNPADFLAARALPVVTYSINSLCFNLQPMPQVEPARLVIPGSPPTW